MKQNRILQIAVIAADLVLAAICITAYVSEDRVKPEFFFQPSEYRYSASASTDMLLQNVTARDDRDGDVTENIVVEKITENREGSTVVIYYAVRDSAGNVAKVSRVFPADFEDKKHVEPPEAYSEAQASEVETLKNDASREPSGKVDEADQDEEDTASPDSGQEDNTEKAAENETENHPQDDVAKEPGNDREEADHDEENDDIGEQDAGQQELPAASGNGAPVLSLRKQEVTIDAGTSPPWTEIIETLRDDKDNYEYLYYHLTVSKFNNHKPGDYPVTLYTEDSDGNQSQTVTVTVHVRSTGA